MGDPKQTRQSARAASQDSNKYIPPAHTSNDRYRCGADLEPEMSVENSEAVGGTSMVVGYTIRNSKLSFEVFYFPIDLLIPVVVFYSPHESRQIQAKLIYETTGVELALSRCTVQGRVASLTRSIVIKLYVIDILEIVTFQETTTVNSRHHPSQRAGR